MRRRCWFSAVNRSGPITDGAQTMAAQSFQPGAILVESGTILPAAMLLEPDTLLCTWRSVSDPEHVGLPAQLTKAGWTLFFMTGAIHKWAFGFDETKRVHAAVGRIIKDVQDQKCNCLEITHLVTKAFLGIPYVSITAHARHIQTGCQFRGLAV
jgi:hypothetical protein